MRVRKLCQKLLSETSSHKQRIVALSEVVETAIIAKTLSVTTIGRNMENKNQTRSNIRKADRLYSNTHLHEECEEIYAVMAKTLIKTSRPFIVIDGSKLPNSPWYILRASLVNAGRALTLYEYQYEQHEQCSAKLYERFLQKLERILGDDVQPILITDAEFRTPWFKLVAQMGWDYIGRIRGEMQCAIGDESFQSCQQLFNEARRKPRCLGQSSISYEHDYDGYLYLHKRRDKGRRAHTRSGRHSDTLKSQRFAKASREPWLLFSSLFYPAEYLIKAYELRMTIEENFRDMKSGRYGLGLTMTFSKQKRRYDIMLLIAMLASTIAYLIGAVAEKKGVHRQFQANSISEKRILSRFFLGCELIKKQFRCSFRQIKTVIKHLQIETYLCFGG